MCVPFPKSWRMRGKRVLSGCLIWPLFPSAYDKLFFVEVLCFDFNRCVPLKLAKVHMKHLLRQKTILLRVLAEI